MYYPGGNQDRDADDGKLDAVLNFYSRSCESNVTSWKWPELAEVSSVLLLNSHSHSHSLLYQSSFRTHFTIQPHSRTGFVVLAVFYVSPH